MVKLLELCLLIGLIPLKDGSRKTLMALVTLRTIGQPAVMSSTIRMEGFVEFFNKFPPVETTDVDIGFEGREIMLLLPKLSKPQGVQTKE